MDLEQIFEQSAALANLTAEREEVHRELAEIEARIAGIPAGAMDDDDTASAIVTAGDEMLFGPRHRAIDCDHRDRGTVAADQRRGQAKMRGAVRAWQHKVGRATLRRQPRARTKHARPVRRRGSARSSLTRAGPDDPPGKHEPSVATAGEGAIV